MAFDKHTTHGKEEHPKHDERDDNKINKKKKPFEEGSNTDKGRNLDAYDKEQKNDKELGERKGTDAN